MRANQLPSLLKGIIYPFVLLILLTPWMETLDLNISRYFFSEQHFSLSPVWTWIYHYGIFPGWVLAFCGCAGLLLSYWRFPELKRPCLYLILVLALGSGLFIHLVLKDNWGRPRPRQVEEFGGNQSFHNYYSPSIGNPQGPSKSFSCGHCSMGFYFFSLALVGRWKQSPFLFWSAIGLAAVLGVGLSLARIAQGGHFFSDTLVSAIIMWEVAWIGAYVLLIPNMRQR